MKASYTNSDLNGDLEIESLYEGDHGPAVAQLQTKLAELNLYTSDITGQFDTQTKQALQAFQCQYGLTEEAGYFGIQTWYALTFWSQETKLSLPRFTATLKPIQEFIKGCLKPLFMRKIAQK